MNCKHENTEVITSHDLGRIMLEIHECIDCGVRYVQPYQRLPRMDLDLLTELVNQVSLDTSEKRIPEETQ